MTNNKQIYLQENTNEVRLYINEYGIELIRNCINYNNDNYLDEDTIIRLFLLDNIDILPYNDLHHTIYISLKSQGKVLSSTTQIANYINEHIKQFGYTYNNYDIDKMNYTSLEDYNIFWFDEYNSWIIIEDF